ncbi:MAG: hypothetical protein K1X35_02640 [Caulobacteraceae bacterium]|nr:hypothetical protein [Caulobacteraceae bacterium]
MIFLVRVRGWGVLVPVVVVFAIFAALLIGRAFHIQPQDAVAFRVAVAGLTSGAILWFVDHRIREGSGYVSYDAETDQPVVEDEDTSPFFGFPMQMWAIALPVIGLILAVAMWVSR